MISSPDHSIRLKLSSLLLNGAWNSNRVRRYRTDINIYNAIIITFNLIIVKKYLFSFWHNNAWWLHNMGIVWWGDFGLCFNLANQWIDCVLLLVFRVHFLFVWILHFYELLFSPTESEPSRFWSTWGRLWIRKLRLTNDDFCLQTDSCFIFWSFNFIPVFHRQGDSSMRVPSLGWTLSRPSRLPELVDAKQFHGVLRKMGASYRRHPRQQPTQLGGECEYLQDILPGPKLPTNHFPFSRICTKLYCTSLSTNGREHTWCASYSTGGSIVLVSWTTLVVFGICSWDEESQNAGRMLHLMKPLTFLCNAHH